MHRDSRNIPLQRSPSADIAVAANRSLGDNAAAACAALSGAGSGATRIDAAALTEAKPLAVAPGGPTPAARVSPETPPFCRVLGHIDPTEIGRAHV